jgi:hypothetical protein
MGALGEHQSQVNTAMLHCDKLMRKTKSEMARTHEAAGHQYI